MEDNTISFSSNIINNLTTTVLPNKYPNNIIIEKVDRKQIIICIHKNIPKDDIDLLRSYGKVLFFEDHHQNIELSSFSFDYLIIDLRNEIHRDYYKINLMKGVNNLNDNYYFVLYRYCFEGNNGIYYNNEITDFPRRQVDKNSYDKLLLLPNVYEPKWYVSLIRLFCPSG
jgi:hypothetical protein